MKKLLAYGGLLAVCGAIAVGIYYFNVGKQFAVLGKGESTALVAGSQNMPPFDFGGMYGRSMSPVSSGGLNVLRYSVNNPVTRTTSCPTNYTDIALYYSSNQGEVHYCYRPSTDNDSSALDFGGIFNTSNQCPAGYQVQAFSAGGNLFVCYRVHTKGVNPALIFGGFFSTSTTTINVNLTKAVTTPQAPNPATSALSCTTGFNQRSVTISNHSYSANVKGSADTDIHITECTATFVPFDVATFQKSFESVYDVMLFTLARFPNFHYRYLILESFNSDNSTILSRISSILGVNVACAAGSPAHWSGLCYVMGSLISKLPTNSGFLAHPNAGDILVSVKDFDNQLQNYCTTLPAGDDKDVCNDIDSLLQSFINNPLVNLGSWRGILDTKNGQTLQQFKSYYSDMCSNLSKLLDCNHDDTVDKNELSYISDLIKSLQNPLNWQKFTSDKIITDYNNGQFCPDDDRCSNIDGVQKTVPAGYIRIDTPTRNFCLSLTGPWQNVAKEETKTCADGYHIEGTKSKTFTAKVPAKKYTSTKSQSDADKMAEDDVRNQLYSKTCVPDGTADVCPNISGQQITVPPGMHIDSSGNCVNNTDMCPNLPGTQTTVPGGYTINTSGNCVPTTQCGYTDKSCP